MTAHTKRIEGLIFAALGLLLFFVVIPAHTETIDYGWLRPDTVPNLMAVVLFLCGVWMSFLPPAHEQTEDPHQIFRTAFYLGVIAFGVFCISVFGFLVMSPFLSLAIMLLIGERRWLWLAIGVAGMPAFIWFAVEILLDRPLPG